MVFILYHMAGQQLWASFSFQSTLPYSLQRGLQFAFEKKLMLLQPLLVFAILSHVVIVIYGLIAAWHISFQYPGIFV